MIKRSASEEVARLVHDVIGDEPTRREAATARLAVIGARAMDRLLAALGTATGAAQRVAVLQVLERIGDARALPPAERLADDADPAVALAAVAVLRALLQGRDDTATRALERLTRIVLDTGAAEDTRSAALDALHELPPDVVAPLLEPLQRDPSSAVRRKAGCPPDTGGVATAAAGNATLEALVEEGLPSDPGILKQALAQSGRAVALPVLHRLVVAVRAREDATADPHARAAWASVRGAAHQVLAERGSRVALYDLRETLATAPGRVSVGMLAALATLGDAACLEPLAAARAASPDPWLREQFAQTFDRIRAREGLTPRHAVMKRIAAKYPDRR